MKMEPEDFDLLIENAKQAWDKNVKIQREAEEGAAYWKAKWERFKRLQYDSTGKRCGHPVINNRLNERKIPEDFCQVCFRFIGDAAKGDLY